MDTAVKKAKYDRATSEQLKFYVHFCRDRPQLLGGKNSTMSPRQMQDLWNNLTNGLNGIRGPTRTTAKWKETLGVWKSQLRARARRLKMSQRVTGGGPCLKPLTELEELALSTFGVAAVEGATSTGSIGLPPPLQEVTIECASHSPGGSMLSSCESLSSPAKSVFTQTESAENYCSSSNVCAAEESLSRNQIRLPTLSTMTSHPKFKHDEDLKSLLRSWSLEHHYVNFVKENVTLKHLRIIQPKFIDKLFQNLPAGDQMLFEHQLQIWKLQMLWSNECSCSSTNKTAMNSIKNGPVATTEEKQGKNSEPTEELDDNIEDMDLLEAKDNNDTEIDSDVEEMANSGLNSLTTTTPTPRVVVPTPRSVPKTTVAPVPRYVHASVAASRTPIAISNAAARTTTPVRDSTLLANNYTIGYPCRYDLSQILTETNGGQAIVNYYNKHQNLREEHRTALINVIARYIDVNGCILTLAESNQLEEQILKMFPTEKAEFYRTTKRGRLYNKVANMKRLYKKFNKDTDVSMPTPTTPPRAISPAATSSSSTTVIKEEEFMDEYSDYVVNDLRAKALMSGNFGEFWRTTQVMRLKSIDDIESLQEILDKWPEYKDANRIEFISMDFFAKHPTATKFSQVFNDSIVKLEKLLFTKVSTCSAAFKTLQLYQKASKESRHLLILWVIHQLFPPNHHVVLHDSGVKRTKRYSILDSQNAAVCIRSSLPLIDEFLKNKETSTPPMLLVVGELGQDIQEIYVYFEDIRYPMKSVVQAAELCLELYFLFNIDFPEEAALYYNFMQTYFLNIEPEVKNSKIYTTINDLNAY